MRTRWLILLALAAAGPASSAALAQEINDTGITTETQERLRRGPPNIDWANLIGALGLLGLLGLRGEHAEDSYHPAAVD
jgi:hypothetical protein